MWKKNVLQQLASPDIKETLFEVMAGRKETAYMQKLQSHNLMSTFGIWSRKWPKLITQIHIILLSIVAPTIATWIASSVYL